MTSHLSNEHQQCFIPNITSLVFPGIKEASWTWGDVLKGFFMESVERNNLSGYILRENVPLWKFGKRIAVSNAYSGETLSIYATGKLSHHAKIGIT